MCRKAESLVTFKEATLLQDYMVDDLTSSERLLWCNLLGSSTTHSKADNDFTMERVEAMGSKIEC